jgi:ligand-binding sensor domain-containing protein/two-component sensor histidine kinase
MQIRNPTILHSPYCLFLCLVIISILSILPIFAEVFPIKTYTTADGLLRDDIVQVEQDSHGFIWFRMHGGLMRYDGYSFKKYTIEDGLPSPHIHWLFEANDGTMWISSPEGLVKYNPKGIPQKFDKNNPANPNAMFQVFQLEEELKGNSFGIVVQTNNDFLWADSNSGLVKIILNNGIPTFQTTEITDVLTFLFKDGANNLWAGITDKGLVKISPDEKITYFDAANGFPTTDGKTLINIQAMMEDRDKRIWIGGSMRGGICRLTENPQPDQQIIDVCYTQKDGLSSDWIYWMQQSSDGVIWISTREKVTQLLGYDRENKPIFRILGEANGLSDKVITDFEEDRDGNLWIPTQNGVKKILRQGFLKFGGDDGLLSTSFSSMFETNKGDFAVIEHPQKTNLSIFRNGKFKTISPLFAEEVDFRDWWNSGQKGKRLISQTPNGEWFMVSQDNKSPVLLRYQKIENYENLAETEPQIIRLPDTAKKIDKFQIFATRNNDVWLASFGGQATLYRWDSKTEKLIDYTDEADLGDGFFQAFVEDDSGNLWFGGSVSRKSDENKVIKLLRYKNGHFQNIQVKENLQGAINDLFIDSQKQLWLASTYNGILRLRDVNAENPTFASYTIAEGLSDNMIFTIAEDKFGRIYAGSGRGVNQITLDSGRIQYFSTKDGLPSGNIFLSKTDKRGAIWFASATGIARFVPTADKKRQNPNIFITGLRVAGVSQEISEQGETNLPEMKFVADKNNLSIDFVGLGASLGENLNYQYRLGDENTEWLTTNERTLNFANLSAGSYQFAVRAVTNDGLISQTPATFSFTILRPIYLRWWFLLLSGLLIGFAIYQLYRFRVDRLLEIERTRTRIATDLHDDIGADLSKISLLSEVVKMQMTNGNEENNRLLTKIAETSRNSVDSMRDIVWAINPSRDSLADLVQKMRQFAEETLVEKDIKLVFNAPNDHQTLKISMNTRRELYLIFKEAVNNASKYADCSEVKIDFIIIGKEISLQISDNGKGFNINQDFDGNGLRNMKLRVAKLNGRFEIDSLQGTKISVNFPQN